jgi:PAS domain S-box-containing protein
MSPNENIRVLLVEDDADDYMLFKYNLKEIKGNFYTLTWANTFESALDIIKNNKHDIYFFDYLLGARTGLDLIKEAVQLGIDAPIIILTGLGNHQADLEAMELGAADYLVKGDIDVEKLDRSIRYCIERSRMIKRLKESELKFRSIFENSHDVIYLTDADGKIMDVNRSAERLFGFTRSELLGMNASDLYENKKDRDRFREEISQTGSCVNFEVILLDKNGNRKYCLLTSNIQKMDEAGTLYYQGIIRDMTQRKKTEHDLMVAEKLAFVGKIARILAHEVRNPITNINLSVEQLEEIIDDVNCALYFDIIKRNSKRINDLVNELLENSKPMELKRVATPINTVLQNTFDLARDRAKLKGLQITTDFKGDNANVLADESKLTIAFLNILINAIEAVKADTGVIAIRSDCDDAKCYIYIEDNGCGIDEEFLKKVFDPYYTSKPNGMGLGLATSQNIIHTHNGKIEVETRINKGTKFKIELDIMQSQSQNQNQTRATAN